MDPPSPHIPRKLGQACDRCRKKKIKCDGALPACRTCTKAGESCQASAPLQRNTRVRGFVTEDKHLGDLQDQLLQCQRGLQADRDATTLLRQQLAQQPVPEHSTSVVAGASYTGDNPAYVIKHMGRMVHDEAGVGRFAGSTTGVHFILSVEEACKRTIHLAEAFPEGCYSLYLARPTTITRPQMALAGRSAQHSPSLDEDIIECLGQLASFYIEQTEEFLRHWAAFCPIIVRKQLFEAIQNVVDTAQNSTLLTMDESTLCILFSIMSINCLTHETSSLHPGALELSAKYIAVAERVHSSLIARADIQSLQGLAIFALYHQFTGKSLALIQLNGHMVRIAQSLGLHHRARRFRMGVGEIDLRKRLWWWIYTFDRYVFSSKVLHEHQKQRGITSIVHGLPPLISDTDVDNDMPTDCRLQDLNATELLHPLPGESTPVSFFNHYAAMGKKMSSVLNLLYTTTRRRHGFSKIERLDRDMRVWSQNLDAGDDPTESSHVQLLPADKGCSLMLLWLRLLTNLSMILIHRVGLTFDDTTPEFTTCLTTCVRSSTDILRLFSVSSLTLYFGSLCPLGPSLVFQCGLMHVYCQCKTRTLGLFSMPSLAESLGAISDAVDILERYAQQAPLTSTPYLLRGEFYPQSISSTIKTLKDLTVLLQHADTQLATESWPAEPLPELSYPAFWVSSLYDLNHMTAMDWAQDISDTFGHLPDLGG
ncbi:hypothetical protein BJX70DRAFT_51235 [Aspergillus crustosus]